MAATTIPSATIKERLARGELVRVFSLGPFASPKLIEMLGLRGGFHGVWIDQEHSAIPHAALEVMLIACRSVGLDAFARVAPTDYATIMRPMEAGAGVMVAQVRSVAQVEEVTRWAKYPPRGVRGLMLGNYEARYGAVGGAEHTAAANRDRFLLIQIETAEAVEHAADIAAVDGVDCLFVGPNDLACTLGVPGDVLHPRCVEALERVAAAAKAAGKSWGVLTRQPEHAARCRELGCRLFSLASDADLIARGLQVTRETYKTFF